MCMCVCVYVCECVSTVCVYVCVCLCVLHCTCMLVFHMLCTLSDLLVSVMSLERQEVDGEEVITLGKDSKDYLRVLNKARYMHMYRCVCVSLCVLCMCVCVHESTWFCLCCVHTYMCCMRVYMRSHQGALYQESVIICLCHEIP